MTLTPFAPLQQRLNGAVLQRLADSQAVVNGGAPIAVIFDAPYAAPFDGQIDSSAPVCTGASSDLAGLQRGDAITINGVDYRVSAAEPDGTGLTRLVLYTPGD